MSTFKALRVYNEDRRIEARFVQMSLDELTAGEVVIRCVYSTINYKDALAITGAGKILRQYPLNAGIDVAGYVESSSDARFKAGDAVVVTGCGLSETLDGGYAEFARVPTNLVIPLPNGLSLYDSMAIGTAGFTAALAVQRMQDNGQSPDLGSIVVTGATGGVGSLAIDMLSHQGYSVTALTSKVAQIEYLKSLGATQVLLASELEMGTRPLEAAQWGGAIDNLGGDVLAWLTRTVKPWGNIASIGLASSIQLNTTVMPFILRAVSLLGINSTDVPPALRQKVWQRLASDLRPQHFDKIITREVSLDEVPSVVGAYVSNQITGRAIVKISQP
ncbi:MAG: oxidoreductase [Thiotrichaceae bacterium]|nr:oxidoreductase [Thiotrichaceae bacterium]